MKTNKTIKEKEKHISFVLDETGSMMSIKDKTIKDFNEYLQSVKGKGEAIFTLTKFNSNKVEVVYEKKLKDVPELTKETYNPDAMTPLYDAIGKTIRALEKDTTREHLLIVLTDGLENASKEFNKDAITKLIAEKEKEGWAVIYLGVGKDAWGAGEKIGILMSASTHTFGRAMNIGTGATKAFMSSGRSGTQYFMSKNKK